MRTLTENESDFIDDVVSLMMLDKSELAHIIVTFTSGVVVTITKPKKSRVKIELEIPIIE